MDIEDFGKGLTGKEMDRLAINTIKALCMDAVQKANSGHPGLPMGAADFTYVLWMRFLKHYPLDPAWHDRDRFVLSAGHGSMLLYSLLHLSGYPLSLDEIKQFRQWGSITPGHPEHGLTPGIETTTGPLGQGFGNAVGMALAERLLADIFNRDGYNLVDHFTYCLVSDGDLMEGISHEAASLAGHLGLGKLISFYDSNRISIEGSTDLAFSEDVGKRFEGYHWHVIEIDGYDHDAIEHSIMAAREEKGRPTLIICHTNIARGSPHKEDSASAHGEPLGEEEVIATKENIGFPTSPPFFIPESVRDLFKKRLAELETRYKEWQSLFGKFCKAMPEKAELWNSFMKRKIPNDLVEKLPVFEHGKEIATRDASGSVLNVLAKLLPNLFGGSADLAPSTKTFLTGFDSISNGHFSGRNLHFGIREHTMGAILNGISLHKGIIPYGGTFLIFSDYMRPAIRLAALMGQPVIFIFTHDSIFLGEDGPTHQPIEHLSSLRAIPNLTVIRPADAQETVYAWQAALEHRDGPVALILTRQKLPVLDRSKLGSRPSGISRGAYILAGSDIKNPHVLLLSSGSEIHLALGVHDRLSAEGISSRVLNMASWGLFERQPEEYKESILPKDMTFRISIEAASPFGWERYTGNSKHVIGINRFGASAPYKILQEKFGFTVDELTRKVMEMIK